jgi:hypothetical protein
MTAVAVNPSSPGRAECWNLMAVRFHGWALNVHLVTQDEDLLVLGAARPGKQGKPAEHAQRRQVGESYSHEY